MIVNTSSVGIQVGNIMFTCWPIMHIYMQLIFIMSQLHMLRMLRARNSTRTT